MQGNRKHQIYIFTLASIVVIAGAYFGIRGYSYYKLSIEQRFFHQEHQLFKPSGIIGHGLGIIGSLFILIGVSTYMLRKRISQMARLGVLKNWLEFHIFLCSLGPVLVLYHTAFKFGGLVAVSFWSMVAVVLSGIIGRYIYLQIPRSIEGRELGLNEIGMIRDDLNRKLKAVYLLDESVLEQVLNAVKERPDRSGKNMLKRTINKFLFERKTVYEIKALLSRYQIKGVPYREIMGLIKEEIALNRKIDRLISMQNLFRYWHIAHMPFALLMLIIMLIHVVVTVTFGAHWIF